jgi:hypothetical protein
MPTKLGTVLIPFQDGEGHRFVVELSRTLWRELAGNVEECWLAVDREAAVGRAMLDIERHESVV